MRDFEITNREVLFSVIIVFVMLAIGFMISSGIENSINSSNKRYAQAVHIDDPSVFNHAITTNVGDAFVSGTISSNSGTISNQYVSDVEFLRIRVEHQEYCRHTRTYTDSDGKVRTEEYYSWDYAGEHNESVDTVTFLEIEFPMSKFKVGNEYYGTYSTGFNRRDLIYGVENNIYGSVFTTISDNDICESSFYKDCDTDTAMERAINSSKFAIAIFWIVWIFIMVAAVFGFVYLENKWLH